MVTRSDLKNLTYIGDGVYAGHDAQVNQIWTFCSNGITDYNFTAFEFYAVDFLYNYKNKIVNAYVQTPQGEKSDDHHKGN